MSDFALLSNPGVSTRIMSQPRWTNVACSPTSCVAKDKNIHEQGRVKGGGVCTDMIPAKARSQLLYHQLR